MRFAAKDHRGVVLPIVDALKGAGHQLVEDDSADLYLIDYDVDRFEYRNWIDFYADAGTTVLLYPHGNGIPPIHYDGLFAPYEKVAGQLAFGPGEERLLRTLEIDRPVCDVGWVGVPQLPFRPAREIRKVTFAPIHANPDGTQLAVERETNAKVFERLLEGPWELTVRFLTRLDDNGLWPDKRARYVMAYPDGGVDEIDSADVVVAGWGSYLGLAVARGAPAVTYCQDVPMQYGLAGVPPVERRRRRLYDPFVRYPYDLLDDARPAEEILQEAATREATGWRKTWQSPAVPPQELAERIERFVVPLSNGKRPKVASVAEANGSKPFPTNHSVDFSRYFHGASLHREWRWAPSEQGVQVAGVRLRAYGKNRYLELLKRCVLNLYWPPNQSQYLRLLGLDEAEDALSTSGYERLSHLHRSVETVLDENVPGDLIEVGVGRGGGTMIMREALGEDEERLLYAVDAYTEATLAEVNEAFVSHGVDSTTVHFVIGMFADTLPHLDGPWSLIRLDGGPEAIELGMKYLYPNLAPGGFCIVNDYELCPDSKPLVDPYKPRHVDPVGACWRKSKEESQ